MRVEIEVEMEANESMSKLVVVVTSLVSAPKAITAKRATKTTTLRWSILLGLIRSPFVRFK